MNMRYLRFSALGAALLVIASGCGGSGPSNSAVAGGIKARVRSLDTTVAIHGEQLIAPRAVVRLYEARNSKPLWTDANDAELHGFARAVYARIHEVVMKVL